MRIGNRVMKTLVIVISILSAAVAISYTNHRFHLKKEEELFKPLGKITEVNGSRMSIYTEGTGEDTLIFMSGGGTCSPILDFKSLYSELSDRYRIAVIEKAGYGFSDISNKSRDIDEILSESREALKNTGVEGPYILCPHSMSGIEAVYWAQKYPQEVKAIIGLDMAVIDAYSDYSINMPVLKIGSAAADIGLTRFIPNVAESDAIKYGTLDEKEKEIYRAVFYRRTATKTMLNEVEKIKSNAVKVKEGPDLNIPMLMFCSNGKGTGWNEDTWRKLQNDYIANNEQGKLIYLDCSHYVHNHEYKKISKDMKSFINEIKY